MTVCECAEWSTFPSTCFFFLGKLATRAKVEFEGGWGEFECDIVAK